MDKVEVLMIGPGKAGRAAGREIEDDGGPFSLAQIALCGEKHKGKIWRCKGKAIRLIGPADHANELTQYLLKREREGGVDGFAAVIFASSNALIPSLELCITFDLPVIVCTSVTPEQRETVEGMIARSGIPAIIAPNMNPYVVLTTAMLEWLAREFPGVLKGCVLYPKESHQRTKKPGSATITHFIEIFVGLGATIAGAISIRNPLTQKKLGIKNLMGHGYHWLKLVHKKARTIIEIIIKVEGRSSYGIGIVLFALPFLLNAMEERMGGRIFTMVDAMRWPGPESQEEDRE